MKYPAESRTRAQLLHHYELEKVLARRLRNAAPQERSAVYCEVYDELFRRVGDHPQLQASASPERRQREIQAFSGFLEPWLGPAVTVVEIGAGDCKLAGALCQLAKRVVAIDVTQRVAATTTLPANLEFIISDGSRIDLDSASVDLAFSNQFLEHIHPDDARRHLQEVARVLKPGACYVCFTPNRLTGPHDISRDFDPIATGFHLHEYTGLELRRIMRECGFRRVDFALARNKRLVRYPLAGMTAVHFLAHATPVGLRPWLRGNRIMCKLLSIQAIARK